MPATVLDLLKIHDPNDAVHRAVQALAEGKVIALPTETVYGLAVSGLCPEAVERLCAQKARLCERPLAIAVKSADDALDYVPTMSPLARRLARRCWPGPLTIVFPEVGPDSVITQLSKDVQRRVAADGSLGIRVPAHPLFLSVLRFCRGPIVLTSANVTGKPEPLNAQQVLDSMGDSVDLIVDDGPCRFGQSSTVVRVDGDHCSILREGVIARKTLKRMASFNILLVCTGNTCRSPMAECLMKDALAKRFKCKVEQLPEHGIMVASAGVAAHEGSRASREAVTVMAQRNLDLSLHESQAVSENVVHSADLILTMTHSHKNALLSYFPMVAGRTFVLSGGSEDVSDPIGGSVAIYEECASQIQRYVDLWAAQIELHLPQGLEDGK
ncbi:MAG: L-threonylcarbamoyladenylate synthase [Pirellulaceae bacterium]|nr:L-threonylcarbamoyladenylate synthase [Pirellulaceae bacterium]